jgi:putative membrane protein
VIHGQKTFMKKKLLSFAICLSAALIWSCNNSGETTNTGDSSSTATETGTDTMSTANNITVSTTPLSKNDSMFVMEAAIGGLMEVQAGQLAQQNAQSQRVKDFGSMMVTDHSKANDELKSYAAGHGITLPTELPADKQKHVDAMKNMKGAAFDKHYIAMMVEDHKEDVGKFKKQSTDASDAQLKTWAGNTLPVLQKHLDSVQAIKKGM